MLKLSLRASDFCESGHNSEFYDVLGSTITVLRDNNIPAMSEVKRRGCVIDLVRKPDIQLRVGDELVVYLRIS